MQLPIGARVRHLGNSDTGVVLRGDSDSCEVAWEIRGCNRWERASSLQRVDTTPTEPGWYWFRPDPEHDTPVGPLRAGPHVVLVELGANPSVRFNGGTPRFPLSLLKGDWERIEPPAWMRDG